MAAEELTVSLPNGEEIVRAPGLAIEPGERVLVTGPSGSGKTSLFRALGGVWPFGAGTIRIPKGAKLLVLPQKPYLPLGTLRGALAYPGPQDDFSPAEIDEVLTRDRARRICSDALDETAYWADRLSVGEQQRLSIARALLQKPDWLFLDEATAALDEPAEAMLYRLLLDRLPDAAIVSIGHRSSLVVFHERFLALKPDGKGRHRLDRGLSRRRRSRRRRDGPEPRLRQAASLSRPSDLQPLSDVSPFGAPQSLAGTLRRNAPPNVLLHHAEAGRRALRTAGEVDDPEIIVVAVGPGLRHAFEHVELQQLAQRHRLARRLRFELGIGDVLVLPHHHHGLALPGRIRQQRCRGLLGAAVERPTLSKASSWLPRRQHGRTE